MKEKLSGLLQEYGRLALATYFGIFFLVLIGFYLAILGGFQPDGVTEGMGGLVAAWVATKLTQPLRIGATFLLTPLVAKLVQRFRAKGAEEADAIDSSPTA